MRFLAATLLSLSMTTPTMASNDDKVLVFGGTGRLGAPIVRLLVDAGHPVTVFARPTSGRARLEGLAIDYVIGDLTDGDSVAAALDGRSFAYVVDASARGRSREPFYDSAMRSILAALDGPNVRQFILHGSVGAGDNMQNFPDVGFGRMRVVLEAKGRAEDMLRSSGIPYTIIRNGLVKADGTPATGTARLTEDDTALDAVTRLDLAALTLQCLGNADCMDKTFHAVDVGSVKTTTEKRP